MGFCAGCLPLPPPDPFATLPSFCSVPPEAEFCGPHQWATWCPGVIYRELRRMWARRRRVRSESWCWELPPGGVTALVGHFWPKFPTTAPSPHLISPKVTALKAAPPPWSPLEPGHTSAKSFSLDFPQITFI